MNIKHVVAGGVSILLLGLTVQAVPAAATQSGEGAALCDNKGQKWYEVSNLVKPKKLTHHERYYNGTGTTMTTSFSASVQRTLTAGITYSSGGGASASVVIAKLEASTNLSLAASGSRTNSSNVGVSAQLPHGKYLVAYRGNVEVSGTYRYWSCTSGGLMISLASGTGKSFATHETGAQRCDLAAPSGSMASLAKSTRC